MTQPNLTQPTYFTVVGDFRAILGYNDAREYDPKVAPISGEVTFTPMVLAGDVIRATTATPRPIGYVPLPVTGVIDPADGRVKLVAQEEGDPFIPVRLLADSPLLELESPLYYRVTFSNIKLSSKKGGSITGFAFQAPNRPDAEINLITVMRRAGQPASGVLKVAPGAVRLLDDGRVQFSFAGVDIPDPLDLTVLGGGSGGSGSWATLTGKPVVIAAGGSKQAAADVIDAVRGSRPGLKVWTGTADEYEAIAAPDPNTMYLVVGDSLGGGLGGGSVDWSAAAAWLESLVATWSNKTLVDPVVEGAVTTEGLKMLPDRFTPASALMWHTLEIRHPYRNFETVNDHAFYFQARKTSGNISMRFILDNGFTRIYPRLCDVDDKTTPVELRLNSWANGNANGSNVTVNGDPIVTLNAVQAISNKTLSTSTLVNPQIQGSLTLGDGMSFATDPDTTTGNERFRVISATSGALVAFARTPGLTAAPRFNFLSDRNDRLRIQTFGNATDIGIDFDVQGKGIVTVGGGKPVGVKVAVPASSTAAGQPGQWAANNTHLFVYTGDGTTHAWRRTATETW